MRSDLYIKLIVFFLSLSFIYASIKNYRYQSALSNGIAVIKAMAKEKISPVQFARMFTEAEGYFSKAIELDSELDEPHYYLGVLYLNYLNADFEMKRSVSEETGLTDESAERRSVDLFKNALSRNPCNIDAGFSLAWIYESQGLNSEADHLVQRAVECWPNKLRVKMKLLEWAVLRKDTEKVRGLSREIYEVAPEKLTALLNVIWRVYQDYEDLKSFVPEKAKAREVFSRFLKSKGMVEQAKFEEEYAKRLNE